MTAAAVTYAETPFYDAGSRCFDGGRLKWEMVRRNVSPEELSKRTGLGITTIKEARKGRSIRESSAMKILRELDRIAPMTVGSV